MSQVTPIDVSQADLLLTTTRAVRKRLDLKRPVPRSVIEECIQVALQAPTGSNSQNWQWIVVTDAAKRKGLADLYRKVAEPYLTQGINQQASARAPGDAAYAQQMSRVASSALHLMNVLHEVPVHVIPCMATAPGMPMNHLTGSSIYPAVWSFQLALRARGLGSTLTTLHLGQEKAAAELLGIPDNIRQFALLPVAYTLGKNFAPSARMPLASVLHWDQW